MNRKVFNLSKALLVVVATVMATVYVLKNIYLKNTSTNAPKVSVDNAQPGYSTQFRIDELSGYGMEISKIHFYGDDSVYGWCLNNGASLVGGVGSVSNTTDGYEYNNAKSGAGSSISWLLDNMYRSGSSVSDSEKNLFRKRLQAIMDSQGLEDNISNYSDNDIFAYEQFALWKYTNNFRTEDNIVYPTSNALYNALVNEAANNSSYTHQDTFVTVDKTDAVLDGEAIGPFSVDITGPALLASNTGAIYTNKELTAILEDGQEYSGSVYLRKPDDTQTVTLSWSYYTTTAYTYETSGNPDADSCGNQQFIMITRESDSDSVEFEIEEERPTGEFSISLSKYKKNANGTVETLDGAEFTVTIPELNYISTQTTANGGKATFSGIEITGEGEKYTVNVEETLVPGGYISESPKIKFPVTTKLVDKTYMLVADGDITNNQNEGYELSNIRKVVVNEGEILIEAENRTTSIDIHKGVKTVKNQNSGYYSDNKTNTEESTENVNTADVVSNNKIDLEETYHDWVIETTIPEAVSKYNKYIVTDPIDLTKLDFSGLDRVKVERIDSTGKVLETLVKNRDYKLEYNEDDQNKKGILTITYINRKNGNNFHGAFLTDAGINQRAGIENTKIRATFNTTFKVNEETGKLAVLDGEITNAKNQSTLTFDNGSGTDVSKVSEQPEVHTGAVSVFKYEDTNGNKQHDEGEKALVGAEFKIALTEEDAINGKFIQINGKDLTAVSNEHGIATFTGLSFGGDASDSQKNLKNGLYKYNWETASKDYYIVETVTPEGYEKLEDTIKVTVSKNSSEMIDLTDKINEMVSVGNRPLTFDLALRKWVTEAIVTENGKTVVYETGHHAEDDPEDVVKVDLKKSKLNNVVVKFKYSIKITNEGEVAGEAKEITDYIPVGLKFVQEDNPDWQTTNSEKIVKTDKLKDTTLEPGESAEVEIVLTWINSENLMGVMVNTAEISKDHNKFGFNDIDSIPNNKKSGEDDIDDAPVMLSITTGSVITAYVTLALGFVSIIALGVSAIKKSMEI